MEDVPENIKLGLFRYYVRRATQKYRVAFFQWRDRNPMSNKKELEDNVVSAFEKFFKERPLLRKVTEKTFESSNVSQDFEIKYGFSLDSH